jgi:GAF domain-containing protein
MICFLLSTGYKQTLGAKKMDEFNYTCYTVPDLSEDHHRGKFDYVQGPSCYKFFPGTPLVTQRGIKIGTLCIFTQKRRPQPSKTDIALLVAIAGHLMQ